MPFCIARYSIENMGVNSVFGIYTVFPIDKTQFALDCRVKWAIQETRRRAAQCWVTTLRCAFRFGFSIPARCVAGLSLVILWHSFVPSVGVTGTGVHTDRCTATTSCRLHVGTAQGVLDASALWWLCHSVSLSFFVLRFLPFSYLSGSTSLDPYLEF